MSLIPIRSPTVQLHSPEQIKPLRSVAGVKENSLVHRFISSGKKGSCELCNSFHNKLEAHHIKYSPEVTILLCHECHHKVHFWPLRLLPSEKFKLFSKLYNQNIALQHSQQKYSSPTELACKIAPSRKEFIHSEQKFNARKDVIKSKKSALLTKQKLNKSVKIREIRKERLHSFSPPIIM